MSLLGRRGFTLVELLIAMVLLGLVSTALYKVLLNNQRTFAAQTQRIDLQQNIRAAATILPAEFRELDASNGDIRAMSATSITIFAMRQLAIICTAPVSACRLRPMSGNAGKYMSIAKGPMAEISPSVMALRRNRVSIGQKVRAAPPQAPSRKVRGSAAQGFRAQRSSHEILSGFQQGCEGRSMHFGG